MRIANRLIAFIVAMALIGVGIILVIEVIAARSGAAPVIIHWHSILGWGRRNTWTATSVELACAISAAVGSLLLLPQLHRRHPSRVAVASSGATDAALTRKGLVVTVRCAVSEVEGISHSRVNVKRRRIKVNATSAAATDGTVEDAKSQVQEAVQRAVDELRLTANRQIRVSVATRNRKATNAR